MELLHFDGADLGTCVLGAKSECRQIRMHIRRRCSRYIEPLHLTYYG